MFESGVAAAVGSLSRVAVVASTGRVSPERATDPTSPNGVTAPACWTGTSADSGPDLPVDPDPGALAIASAGYSGRGSGSGSRVGRSPDVEVEASLQAHLRDLLTAPPGAVTAAAVQDLLASNLTTLDDTASVDLIAATHRLVSWATACHLTAIAHLSRRWTRQALPGSHRGGLDAETAADLAHRAVVTETALACGMSEYAAEARAQAATELTTRLPATHQALRNGTLDWPRVQAITGATAHLDDATARAVEAAVLPAAPAQNVPALRRALAAAVLTTDPTAAAERHELLRSQRRVACTPLPDGMGELWAYLPAPDLITVRTCLDQLSSASSGDPRTRDQRRADAFVEVFAKAADRATPVNGDPAGDAPADAGPSRGGLADADDVSAGAGPSRGGPSGAGPSRGGPTDSDSSHPRPAGRPVRRAEIVVTIPLSALTHPERSGLADLSGYGPVPAAAVADLLVTGTWRCAAVDDRHHTLLGLGATTFTPTYRPSRPAQRHLALRDRTCTFPGCHQPARRCDLDHSTPHPQGPTCECNLITLCRHHHRLKHHGGFRVRAATPGDASSDTPAGTLLWATPAGRHYPRPPNPLVPVAPATGTAADGRPDSATGGPDTAAGRPDVHEPPPF